MLTIFNYNDFLNLVKRKGLVNPRIKRYVYCRKVRFGYTDKTIYMLILTVFQILLSWHKPQTRNLFVVIKDNLNIQLCLLKLTCY